MHVNLPSLDFEKICVIGEIKRNFFALFLIGSARLVESNPFVVNCMAGDFRF